MKIGLLPFYIKLYDDVAPQYRPAMEAFAALIAEKFTQRNIEVFCAPICRVKSEFSAAIHQFEQEQVQAIVTLHLAYSPSLESIEALSETMLPILVLDTTPDFSFGFEYGDKVMCNHGIHGVQDFCNLLIRHGKPFLIAAGHWERSTLFDKAELLLKGAAMAHKIRNARIGTVGGRFDGMGDFLVPDGTFGMTIVPYSPPMEAQEAQIATETTLDQTRFVSGEITPGAYQRTLRASLKLRSWLEKEQLDGFTLCFPGITRANGWETVPFLECSKAMARGIGYAGEGDTLTAALHAALLSVSKESTFSEMFCPDWESDRIFVSHMGEINIDLTARKPLLHERSYQFSDTGNPVLATGCCRPGQALLINLAPGAQNRFKLIVAPVILSAPETPSGTDVCGFFSPASGNIETFLESYSRLGGTHHLILSYDLSSAPLQAFAQLMDWDFHQIPSVDIDAASNHDKPN